MSRRQPSDHGSHAHLAHRESARGGAETAARREAGHSASVVGPRDVGLGEGSGKAATLGRGVTRTPRRDRPELRRAPRSSPSGPPFDARSAMDALGDAIIVIAPPPDWRVRYI